MVSDCFSGASSFLSQCIPYLITISTDLEPSVRVKANQQLTEHSGRYGHFVQVGSVACAAALTSDPCCPADHTHGWHQEIVRVPEAPVWGESTWVTRRLCATADDCLLPSLAQTEARGFMEQNSSHTSLLAHVYSLVRSNKQHRRAMLRAVLRYFEDYEVSGLIASCPPPLMPLALSTAEEPPGAAALPVGQPGLLPLCHAGGASLRCTQC